MTEPTQNPMVLHLNTAGRARPTTFGYHTDDHPTLDRIQNAISLAAGLVAGLAIVIMVILSSAEVFSRWAFDHPLGWNVSFVERFLLVAGAFFGIVTAYRTSSHVAVTSVFTALPHSAQKVLHLATLVIISAVFALLFWYGLQATLSAWSAGEIPPKGATELPIPEWIWRSFIPFGSVMALAIVLIDLYREITAPWSELATDYEPGDTATEVHE